ncbi:MAG TPA: hypothetical protein VGR00_07315, partial [Thermoanaerobaculia bacterium]|nr:hypothetical protein [Thermoanaerobaculia bacterium]
NYAVAKIAAKGRSAPRCSYTYAGGDFFGAPAAAAWEMLLAQGAPYVVTVDPAVYAIPELPANKTLDRENFPIFFQKLRTSPLFEREAPLAEDPGIVIFRRVASP